MLSIPPQVAAIIIRGLEAEIERQAAIGAVCGDDWPDDYDPNDVAIYRGFRQWLLENIGRDAIIQSDFAAKPVRFVMGLIPFFVRNSIDHLSASEVDAAFRTFSQYVAQFCSEILQDQVALRSSKVNWTLHLLSQLIEFPSKTHNDAAKPSV